jgi:hypothetical protein
MKTIYFFFAIIILCSCVDKNSTDTNLLKENITFKVLDENSNPIENAKISILPYDQVGSSLAITKFTDKNGQAQSTFFENDLLEVTAESQRNGVTYIDIQKIVPIGNLDRELILEPFKSGDATISLRNYVRDVNLYVLYWTKQDTNLIKSTYKSAALYKYQITATTKNIQISKIYYYIPYLFVIEYNNKFKSWEVEEFYKNSSNSVYVW